ncbi:FAD-binding oxidoreductase [Knoellia sp. p5-6-4]|uniref:FAD-binding oxidoreductase n=1 Tax=unclassified Knoellia TaxID=2618719 RepID=UPI0023DB66E5|nr:FAD-binding oxidoreductase [Knoellia sp. p5-6-4]MDF2144390.1 FAD-binding oxidoreductase [Knoellia sp. p5-6-4]
MGATDPAAPADVTSLREGFDGAVLLPTDAGYEQARVLFNAMIDRRPAVIAQCASPDDVARAIGFARGHDLDLSVRGGGHGVAGTALAEGGLVVDLRRMCTVDVDPAGRTARVGGGATMSHLDRACQPFDLATTGGRVSTTGVGGFTLGGGTGWLDRRFGLACDNLLSAELVTAAGEQVVASDAEHPDLFWALHGGGGNFGVATALTFRLHEVPTSTLALLMWRPEEAEQVLRAVRDLFEGGPDEIGGGALWMTAPEEEFVPAELAGRLVCAAVVVFVGPEEGARDVIAPLLALRPGAELVAEMPYADLQSSIDDPPGYRNYWSAEHLSALPDEAVAAFCRVSEQLISPAPAQSALFAGGGAAGRATTDYPIPWRRDPWTVHPFGLWADPVDDERVIGWTRELRSAVRPWATGAVYLNFIGDEGADRVRAGLGEANFERLAAIKRVWDPDNLFRRNHNIAPVPA